MKHLLIYSLLFLLISGCAASKKSTDGESGIDLEKGEEEHELIITDTEFNTWYETRLDSSQDRSRQFYDHWNDLYVRAWNNKAALPGSAPLFINRISYDENTDYGLSIERKLYYYFQWVETELGIPILKQR